MNRTALDAALILAGIKVSRVEEITNRYTKSTEAKPWYLVVTENGQLVIGRRSRVVEVDYSATNRRGELTTEDVTKSECMIHAWTNAKLVEYLTLWKSKEASETFYRLVASGRASIEDYFKEYAGERINGDKVIAKLLESLDNTGPELYRNVDPVSKLTTFNLYTGISDIKFDFSG